MRTGDLTKSIAPSTPKSIAEAFRGKEKILELLAFLNPKGMFIEVLSNEDTVSQYPQIQRFAKWVGVLRKRYAEKLTNTHERNIFNFLYGDDKNSKIKKEDFEELIRERLEMGKEVLFPECPEGEPCKKINNLKELPPNGHLYKQISEISKDLQIIQERINNSGVRDATRVYTNEERDALKMIYKKLETKLLNLKRDLGIIENTDKAGLFGTDNTVKYIVYATENKQKIKFFSDAPTITGAKLEAKEQFGKKILILKVVKI